MTSPVRGIVDLSHPLDDDTPVYPGDPVARFEPATTISEHGYNVLHVRMGSQTGTHVDAPSSRKWNGASTCVPVWEPMCTCSTL